MFRFGIRLYSISVLEGMVGYQYKNCFYLVFLPNIVLVGPSRGYTKTPKVTSINFRYRVFINYRSKIIAFTWLKWQNALFHFFYRVRSVRQKEYCTLKYLFYILVGIRNDLVINRVRNSVWVQIHRNDRFKYFIHFMYLYLLMPVLLPIFNYTSIMYSTLSIMNRRYAESL